MPEQENVTAPSTLTTRALKSTVVMYMYLVKITLTGQVTENLLVAR